jgi:hypothetical protein
MKRLARLTGAVAVMAATAVAVPQSLSAQGKKLEISGFAGWYLPTNKDAMQLAPSNQDAARRGSLAWGGRLTVWTASRLGFEFTGGFSPARVRVASTIGIFPHSTDLTFGSAKLALKLTPGDPMLGVTISGGLAGLHYGKTVADPTKSETKFGGVGGLGLRLRLADGLHLRGDIEDYFYSGRFGNASSKLVGDLMLTGGLSIGF